VGSFFKINKTKTMALIKIRNNASGAGSTVAGVSIAGCREVIIDVDLPILVTQPGPPAAPDFRVLVTGTSGVAGQNCDITVVDATPDTTIGDIYYTLTKAVEDGIADDNGIPTVSSIIKESTGAGYPIRKIVAP
jgi:hypothetical protein